MKESGGTLIVGPAWVGDMIMAQSLFKTLKAKEPDRPIDVVAPTWSLPLLARMPEVREGIELPVGHGELGLSRRFGVGRSLRTRKYAKAIVLPRSLKAALVPWVAKIPHRIGYRGEMRYGLINDVRPLDKTVLTQTVQRFVALGHATGDLMPPSFDFPRLVVDEGNQSRLLASLNLSLERPAVALLPGAEYGPAKQWPVEHFSALAQGLVEQGAQCWVFGSHKERHLGETIAREIGEGVRNLCGETRLIDAVDLLAAARAAVSNDSGLMHIAAAVIVPVIAIYGSSSPELTPPLSGDARIVYLDLECSPCFDRVCHLGHTNCMDRVDPRQVLSCTITYIQ